MDEKRGKGGHFRKWFGLRPREGGTRIAVGEPSL